MSSQDNLKDKQRNERNCLKLKHEEEQKYLVQKQKRQLLVQEQKQRRQLVIQEQKHELQLVKLAQNQQQKSQIEQEKEFAREHIRCCSCVHLWFRMRICMYNLCTTTDVV